ncbi:MAG TPA: RNA polymerase sigma factor [Bacteroidales bacterium]|nr:RNA polymerase sigma factor [Bacteroidales bacterium]HPE40255.1 RNA polymerase sigma factor [Bacteroidales bacterium]
MSISKIDKELLEGCLKNDRLSQRKLYEKYASKMLLVCMRYAKTKEDAEDILIEGFVKVFSALEKFKMESSLETWIHSIMVNASISYFRKNNKHYMVDSIDEGNMDIPNEYDLDGLDHLTGKDLLNILQQMPEHLKCVFNLVAFEGYDYEKIAEELDINIGTARSRMSKGKSWLQERIKTMHNNQ